MFLHPQVIANRWKDSVRAVLAVELGMIECRQVGLHIRTRLAPNPDFLLQSVL